MTTPTPANTPSTAAETNHVVIDMPLWLPAAEIPSRHILSKSNNHRYTDPNPSPDVSGVSGVLAGVTTRVARLRMSDRTPVQHVASAAVPPFLPRQNGALPQNAREE
jgi:hypothetical protein